MTDEQREVLEKVKQWLAVRIEHQNAPQEVKDVWQQLTADIDHSALLGRLLEGKEPFDIPPPLSYSYPWYTLIEDGFAEGGFEVGIHPDGLPSLQLQFPIAHIAQGIWRIAKTVEEGKEYIVEWPQTGLRCCLRNTRAERPEAFYEGAIAWSLFDAMDKKEQENLTEAWWQYMSWKLEIIPRTTPGESPQDENKLAEDVQRLHDDPEPFSQDWENTSDDDVKRDTFGPSRMRELENLRSRAT